LLKRHRGIFLSGFVLICTLAIVFAFREHILFALGAVLDNGEPPQNADIIVVLGGDERGRRILTAAELARQGFAPKVLVSGNGEIYGHFESDLAISLAVHHGYPAELFIASHFPALNTVDEAEADVADLRRLGVHKFLLVTSSYHTSRATRIFKHAAKDLEIHPVSAPDRYWNNGEWWKFREGRKLWFWEMMKTIANYLGV
jgi:uncharacterized SAM-binding protein YcdF (DUF218 family)